MCLLFPHNFSTPFHPIIMVLTAKLQARVYGEVKLKLRTLEGEASWKGKCLFQIKN
jgi:hypothetical protein